MKLYPGYKLAIVLAIAVLAACVQAGGVPPFTTIFMRTVLDDATALAARTTLGIGEGDSPTLTGLDLINLVLEFSTDTTFADNSDAAVPTEKAVKTYVAAHGGGGGAEWPDENRVWREVRYDFSLMKKGASPPGEENESIGASGDILAYNYAFNPAAVSDEEVFWAITVPDDLDESKGIQLGIGWFPDSGWSSGNYRWAIEYLIRDQDIVYGGNVDRTAGTPTTIYEDTTPANATDLIRTNFEDPNTIDADRHQIIFCRLYLDASESSADNDGHLIYVVAQYAADQPGTQTGVRLIDEAGNYLKDEYDAYLIEELS